MYTIKKVCVYLPWVKNEISCNHSQYLGTLFHGIKIPPPNAIKSTKATCSIIISYKLYEKNI